MPTEYDPRAAAEAADAEAPLSEAAKARRRIAKRTKAGQTPSVLDRQYLEALEGAKAGAIGRLRTLAADTVAAAAKLAAATDADYVLPHLSAAGRPCSNAKCNVCGGSGAVDSRAVLAAAEEGAKANRAAHRAMLTEAAAEAAFKAAALPAATDRESLAVLVEANRKAAALKRAAESARPGIVGRYSAGAERHSLADLRRIIRAEAGPMCRRAAMAVPLGTTEYADMAADLLADVLAAVPAAAPAAKCRRHGCNGEARHLALLDNGVPGTETPIPVCHRHAGHAPGRLILAPAEPTLALMPEAKLRALAAAAVMRWFRARDARLAAAEAADAEAAEGTPAKAAATAMDLVAAEDEPAAIVGTADFLPAAERAATQLGLKLNKSERWAIRWGVHLRRVPTGKAAGTLAPNVTSAALAAEYGATESDVRVGAKRGSERLAATLDADTIREWGRGTGRVLAALGGKAPELVLPDGRTVGTEDDLPAVMRADTKHRGVTMEWPPRVPPRPRREDGRLVYVAPYDPPTGAGQHRPTPLLHGPCPPPRVTQRGEVAQGPFHALSLASVPISTQPTQPARRSPLAPYWDAEARRARSGRTGTPSPRAVTPIGVWRAHPRGVGIATPDTANAEAKADVARVSARWEAERLRLKAAEQARLAARWAKA